MPSQLRNNSLRSRSDEYYTQYADIESEMQYYHDKLKRAVVYCNCDDPRTSNFVKYFMDNYHRLELGGLLASCYSAQQKDLFDTVSPGKACSMRYYGHGKPEVQNLQGDGDFASKECQPLFDEADIIITNPPFSIFGEHCSHALSAGKDYIVIGPLNGSTYVAVRDFIIQGVLGFGVCRKALNFIKPDNEIEKINSIWYSTIDHGHDPPCIEFIDRKADEYPRYDNYGMAIDIGSVRTMPDNYYGLMGAGINFFKVWNRHQFAVKNTLQSPLLNGEFIFKRVIIQRIP